MYYSAHYISPLGPLTLATDGNALVGLWMQGQSHYGGVILDKMVEAKSRDFSPFTHVVSWLDRYFAGEQPKIGELALAPIGSTFRQAVWSMLCEIPYGEVTTYGALAKKMGRARMSSQAIGGAVGHNPISIIIPCHRVIGANGSLTGYAGGLTKKRWLLELEGAL